MTANDQNPLSKPTNQRLTPTGPPGTFRPGPAADPASGVLPQTGQTHTSRTMTPDGPRRRTADTFAVASLLIHLPWVLISAFTVVMLGGVAGTVADNSAARLVGRIAVVMVWLASGALILRPSVETFLARLGGGRPPTPAEQAVLAPIWTNVTTAAGVDGAEYQLWIEDSAELNAAAMSGHIVTVTRGALEVMPPRQLAAVLAHELGHHLGGHAWAALLVHWYTLPARLIFRIVGLAGRVAATVFGAAAAIGAASTRLGPLGFLVFRPVVWLTLAFFAVLYAPLVAIVAAPLLLARFFDRYGELRADRLAAELGYGTALIEVFQNWQRAGLDHDGGWRDRLLASHPSLQKRVVELTRHVTAQQQSGQQQSGGRA